MGKVSLVIGAALALTALTGSEAKAAAYCAYSGGARGGSYENRGYYTWQHCIPAISGARGFCMRNPHDPSLWGYPVEPRPYKQRRRADY
jgi:hypothetical protein